MKKLRLPTETIRQLAALGLNVKTIAFTIQRSYDSVYHHMNAQKINVNPDPIPPEERVMEDPSTIRKSMFALAQFDPAVARALRVRLEGIAPTFPSAREFGLGPKLYAALKRRKNLPTAEEFTKDFAEIKLCARGHTMSIENTYFYNDGRKGQCKTCHHANVQKKREEKSNPPPSK